MKKRNRERGIGKAIFTPDTGTVSFKMFFSDY